MVCILLVSNCILYWVIVSNNKAHGWAFCQCVISIVYQVILSKSAEQGWALLYQISNRVDSILYSVIVWKSAEQGWARLKRGWFCLSAISEQQVRTWITLSFNLIIIIIIFVTIMIILIVIDIVFVFHHSSLLFLHLLIGCLQTQNAKYSKKLELTSKEEGERKKMGI